MSNLSRNGKSGKHRDATVQGKDERKMKKREREKKRERDRLTSPKERRAAKSLDRVTQCN